MKYKIGDEVLVKAKIIEVSSTGIFRIDSNGARYYLQENDIVAEMTAEEAVGKQKAKKPKNVGTEDIGTQIHTDVQLAVEIFLEQE